jgi:hypothetical protein
MKVEIEAVVLDDLLKSCREALTAHIERRDYLRIDKKTLATLLTLSDINPEPQVAQAIKQSLGEVTHDPDFLSFYRFASGAFDMRSPRVFDPDRPELAENCSVAGDRYVRAERTADKPKKPGRHATDPTRS